MSDIFKCFLVKLLGNTRTKIFSEIGKETELFTRFTTVAGEWRT